MSKTNTIAVKRKKEWTPAKRKDLAVDIFFYIILTVISLMCLFPFLHVLAKSISEESYVIANKVVLFPKGFSLSAYQKVFADSSVLRSMFVTIVVTAAFTVIGMFLTICAAYALSRKELKGRKVMTFLIMLTMYFTAGTIPDYLLMSNLHMLDTWWCLILPLCFAPYNLLIMKNNFSASIPDSLVESALIDGAGHFKILARIVVPLSKPIIATIALFYAVAVSYTHLLGCEYPDCILWSLCIKPHGTCPGVLRRFFSLPGRCEEVCQRSIRPGGLGPGLSPYALQLYTALVRPVSVELLFIYW